VGYPGTSLTYSVSEVSETEGLRFARAINKRYESPRSAWQLRSVLHNSFDHAHAAKAVPQIG